MSTALGIIIIFMMKDKVVYRGYFLYSVASVRLNTTDNCLFFHRLKRPLDLTGHRVTERVLMVDIFFSR